MLPSTLQSKRPGHGSLPARAGPGLSISLFQITMNIHKGLPKQRLMVKASITQVPSLIQSRTHFVRLTHVFGT